MPTYIEGFYCTQDLCEESKIAGFSLTTQDKGKELNYSFGLVVKSLSTGKIRLNGAIIGLKARWMLGGFKAI